MRPVAVEVSGVGASKALSGTSIVYRKWVKPRKEALLGGLVELYTSDGEIVGCGLWEEGTPVAVRILYKGPCVDSTPEEALGRLLENAYKARARAGIAGKLDSYRLVNSDGDRLSGLIVDVYRDVAVLQSSSPAIDKHLQSIATSISRIAGVAHVFEKSSQRSRVDIGLTPRLGWLIGRKPEVIIEEGGVKFLVNVVEGQKTGFYLDQRPNRLELARLSGPGDTVLDLFSYTGSFGIHALASGAQRAVFVEEDPIAVRILKRNLELNGIRDRSVEIINSSLWRVDPSKLGESRFTIVSVDPPAFIQKPGFEAKRRGLKAYWRAYFTAVRAASENSIVYLSSCSYFLTRQMFVGLVNDVFSRAGREYRILGDVRGAGPDHVFRGEEYLSYLKGVFIHSS